MAGVMIRKIHYLHEALDRKCSRRFPGADLRNPSWAETSSLPSRATNLEPLATLPKIGTVQRVLIFIRLFPFYLIDQYPKTWMCL